MEDLLLHGAYDPLSYVVVNETNFIKKAISSIFTYAEFLGFRLRTDADYLYHLRPYTLNIFEIKNVWPQAIM